MGVSIDTRQAYSEIDEFLSLLTEEQIKKIPLKLREFFKEEKDKEYKKQIDSEIPIKDQNLKGETLAIYKLVPMVIAKKQTMKKVEVKVKPTVRKNITNYNQPIMHLKDVNQTEVISGFDCFWNNNVNNSPFGSIRKIR